MLTLHIGRFVRVRRKEKVLALPKPVKFVIRRDKLNRRIVYSCTTFIVGLSCVTDTPSEVSVIQSGEVIIASRFNKSTETQTVTFPFHILVQDNLYFKSSDGIKSAAVAVVQSLKRSSKRRFQQ